MKISASSLSLFLIRLESSFDRLIVKNEKARLPAP